MSLFKARDWWHSHCGNGEDYDKGCLCVANIDNNPDEADKLMVGSHAGVLQIFGPKTIAGEDGHLIGFQPDQLLLETQLNFPILQLCVGKLVGGSLGFQLAVLHPRKLCIYSLSVNVAAVEHGTHYHLALLYEHNLQRSAYSLVSGPFGGVKGKELLCVQSLDGALSFYEQESFAFTRFLPSFLLPGPMCYAAKIDSFVTVSSSWSLECYRYQTLAVAKDSEKNNENIIQGKRVVADWTFSLGEAALDIAVIEVNNAVPSIFVLGERSLFVFKENGTMRFMKKLDYSPTCFLPYPSNTDGNIMVMMCTQNQTLLIYSDLTLKWAAQLPASPLCIQRAKLANLNGVIVFLSEDGTLSCCYLGTDPSLFAAPPQESKEFNYEEAEKELKDLRNVISSMNVDSVETRKVEKDASVVITVLEAMNYVRPSEDLQDEKDIPVATVKIQLKAADIRDAKLSIDVSPPLVASEKLFTVPTLSETGHAVEVQVQTRDSRLPFSLNFRVHLIYNNSSGQPRVLESSMVLPLKLVSKGCTPIKMASYKLTLDTNKHCAPLSELFPEFIDSETEDKANAVGIQYYGGQSVTVLASKTSQRYRLQSSSFPALWLIMQELVNRLEKRFRRSDVTISYVGSLPVQEVFFVIEDHFQLRLQKKQLDESLRQRAAQFRVIQKRLLTKMKDKTPTPLNNLDALLEATHQQILYLADNATENEAELKHSSCALSCACQLLKLLLKLSSNLVDESLLETVLLEQIGHYSDEGWEERTDAAITHLLRTCLAKPGKDIPIGMEKLDMLNDLNRLRKHFSVFIDRLTKGSKVVFNSVEEVLEEEEEEEPLLGSQLAEDKKNNKSVSFDVQESEVIF